MRCRVAAAVEGCSHSPSLSFGWLCSTHPAWSTGATAACTSSLALVAIALLKLRVPNLRRPPDQFRIELIVHILVSLQIQHIHRLLLPTHPQLPQPLFLLFYPLLIQIVLILLLLLVILMLFLNQVLVVVLQLKLNYALRLLISICSTLASHSSRISALAPSRWWAAYSDPEFVDTPLICASPCPALLITTFFGMRPHFSLSFALAGIVYPTAVAARYRCAFSTSRLNFARTVCRTREMKPVTFL